MFHKKHCLSNGTATQPNRLFEPSLNDDEFARLAQEAEGILNSAAAIIFWGKCDAFSSLRQLLS